MTQKTRFIVLPQNALIGINLINGIKYDNMYVVLDENNGFTTICQYSKKYDDFHIVTVQTEKLDKSLMLKSADEE